MVSKMIGIQNDSKDDDITISKPFNLQRVGSSICGWNDDSKLDAASETDS